MKTAQHSLGVDHSQGPIQQLRNFIPLGPDKTLIESWIYRQWARPTNCWRGRRCTTG